MTDAPHDLVRRPGESMEIAAAQREVRSVYGGGFAGQLVSGLVWLASAALATWSTPRRAILVLVLGGMLIFPLTQLALRLAGRRTTLGAGNAMGGLATQVAFTVPLNLLVVAGAALYRLDWFYPACLVVVGSHYLPFVFLYGMPHFAALGALLVAAGVAVALWFPSFALGGWIGAALLLLFAGIGKILVARENAPDASSGRRREGA